VPTLRNLNQVGGEESLFLDDWHVGRRFTSGMHPIDEGQIKAFVRQFDPQPFRLDAGAAKGTLFGGLAASGWVKAGTAARLLAVGLAWVALTVLFEVALGRLVPGLPWGRLAEDYDPSRGGLMGLGLVIMTVSPVLAARLRRRTTGDGVE
jgi:hypothetical protein